MGGTSSQQQQSQTVSQPWQPAQAGLTGILGQLQGALGNTQLNPTEQNAYNQLLGSASQGNPFAGSINSYVNSLLGGGGANAQAGNLSNALSQYQAQLTPWASGDMADPSKNPVLAQALQVAGADAANSINSQFAGAGRDLSGINQQAVARGITQAEAPILQQYQQMGLNAANNLYNAGNTTGGLLSQLQQQYLANQGQGLANNQAAIDANNYGAQTTLNLEDMLRNYPLSNLSNIASLLVPIASLGGQTNSSSSGTSTMSGAQQFGAIASGLGSLGKLFSDREMKENILRLGELPNGLPLYSFNFKGSHEPHFGLMAEDVEHVHPEAITRTLLYSMVDYAQAVR